MESNSNDRNPWDKPIEWKQRYSKLYSTRRSLEKEDDSSNRISFMSYEDNPYTSLLKKMRDKQRESQHRVSQESSQKRDISLQDESQQLNISQELNFGQEESQNLTVPEQVKDGQLDQGKHRSPRDRSQQRSVSQDDSPPSDSQHHRAMSQSSTYTEMSSYMAPSSSARTSNEIDDLGGHATLLLNMVRRRSKETQDNIQSQTLNLPKENETEDESSSEACVHGLSVRVTERSVSRSRVSRMSTRRDMDIPSILAFTTNISSGPVPAHLEIPAFQKINKHQPEVPRWSIRRSVCPVCSQRWKDRSSIKNVKYSGLKRISSSDLPSVIAPARLRTSILTRYQPKPALASLDEDVGMTHGGLRNTSATWQLKRARRFRPPKPQIPSPEAIARPSATAPLARKDLDLRVSRFLTDEEVKLVK